MRSHQHIHMVINGENDESRLIATNKPINHKLLRNAYKISQMSKIDKQIYDFDEKIKRMKLRRGDAQIQSLRKTLARVKVFRSMKEIKKRRKSKNFLMLKYQPHRAAIIQAKIEKNAQLKQYGTPLNKLIKKMSKKNNPFQAMIEIQTIIDEAEQPEIDRKKKEKKEIEDMIQKRGMKGVINYVKK